jgi:outer membrane protein TolC
MAFPACMQAQQENTLTLSRAWDLAGQYYPDLKGKQAAVKASAYANALSKSDYLPQFQLQDQNTYGTFASSVGAFFPLPGIINVTGNSKLPGQPDATNNNYASLYMNWKFFEFGRRTRKLEASREYQRQTSAELVSLQLDVKTRITRLYFSVLYDQSEVDWSKDNTQRLKEILSLSKSLLEAGLKPDADTLLASSYYRQALADEFKYEGQTIAHRQILFETIGIGGYDLPLNGAHNLSPPMATDAKDSLGAAQPYLDVISNKIKVGNALMQAAARGAFPSLSVLGGLATKGSGVQSNGDREQWAVLRY